MRKQDGSKGVEDMVQSFYELPSVIDLVKRSAFEVAPVAQENASSGQEVYSSIAPVTESIQNLSDLGNSLKTIAEEIRNET